MRNEIENEMIINQATIDDAPAIRLLSHQLGYPVSEQQTLDNLRIILTNKEEALFVARLGNAIVGWIGVFQSLHLVSGYCFEVAGLVVDSNHQRLGIGKRLLEKAREWSKEKGGQVFRVRTNVKRGEAHKFYRRFGFEEVKEQKVFEMKI